jgi:hypothetical protein
MSRQEHIKWFAQELAQLISENPNDTLMGPVRSQIEGILNSEFYKATKAEPPEWITINRD